MPNPPSTTVADTGCCLPPLTEGISVESVGDLAAAFKAIGDPIRLRLLSMIAAHAGGEVCVCDLTGPFDLSGPTISHHLKVLRKAGLIDCQRRGTWVYYWVIPSRLRQLSAFLEPPNLEAVFEPAVLLRVDQTGASRRCQRSCIQHRYAEPPPPCDPHAWTAAHDERGSKTAS